MLAAPEPVCFIAHAGMLNARVQVKVPNCDVDRDNKACLRTASREISFSPGVKLNDADCERGCANYPACTVYTNYPPAGCRYYKSFLVPPATLIEPFANMTVKVRADCALPGAAPSECPGLRNFFPPIAGVMTGNTVARIAAGDIPGTTPTLESCMLMCNEAHLRFHKPCKCFLWQPRLLICSLKSVFKSNGTVAAEQAWQREYRVYSRRADGRCTSLPATNTPGQASTLCRGLERFQPSVVGTILQGTIQKLSRTPSGLNANTCAEACLAVDKCTAFSWSDHFGACLLKRSPAVGKLKADNTLSWHALYRSFFKRNALDAKCDNNTQHTATTASPQPTLALASTPAEITTTVAPCPGLRNFELPQTGFLIGSSLDTDPEDPAVPSTRKACASLCNSNTNCASFVWREDGARCGLKRTAATHSALSRHFPWHLTYQAYNKLAIGQCRAAMANLAGTTTAAAAAAPTAMPVTHTATASPFRCTSLSSFQPPTPGALLGQVLAIFRRNANTEPDLTLDICMARCLAVEFCEAVSWNELSSICRLNAGITPGAMQATALKWHTLFETHTCGPAHGTSSSSTPATANRDACVGLSGFGPPVLGMVRADILMTLTKASDSAQDTLTRAVCAAWCSKWQTCTAVSWNQPDGVCLLTGTSNPLSNVVVATFADQQYVTHIKRTDGQCWSPDAACAGGSLLNFQPPLIGRSGHHWGGKGLLGIAVAHSPRACADACRVLQECGSFLFETQGGAGTLAAKDNTCRLYYSMQPGGRSAPNSTVFYSRPPVDGRPCLAAPENASEGSRYLPTPTFAHAGKGQTLHLLGAILIGWDRKDCEARCRSDETCLSYSYQASQQICRRSHSSTTAAGNTRSRSQFHKAFVMFEKEPAAFEKCDLTGAVVGRYFEAPFAGTPDTAFGAPTTGGTQKTCVRWCLAAGVDCGGFRWHDRKGECRLMKAPTTLARSGTSKEWQLQYAVYNKGTHFSPDLCAS